MAIIKLDEPYAVTYMRNQVRDALMYQGEEAIALSLVHVERRDDHGTDEAIRCPRCTTDAYPDGEQDCPVCFGVALVDPITKTGVKLAKRIWAVFTDQTMSETYGQRGVYAPDAREVQFEAFPLLLEHDVIVRVRQWDTLTHTPLCPGDFYSLQAITRDSLRTGGNRYSQTRHDVIGQKAQCTLLSRSDNITRYPIEGISFPDVGIIGTPEPSVVAEPDTKVVFVPARTGAPPAPGSNAVLGATVQWRPVFTFTQTAPATQWVINHTLDHDPQVTLYVGGEQVLANVDSDEENHPGVVYVNFQDPQVGYAEVS